MGIFEILSENGSERVIDRGLADVTGELYGIEE